MVHGCGSTVSVITRALGRSALVAFSCRKRKDSTADPGVLNQGAGCPARLSSTLDMARAATLKPSLSLALALAYPCPDPSCPEVIRIRRSAAFWNLLSNASAASSLVVVVVVVVRESRLQACKKTHNPAPHLRPQAPEPRTWASPRVYTCPSASRRCVVVCHASSACVDAVQRGIVNLTACLSTLCSAPSRDLPPRSAPG